MSDAEPHVAPPDRTRTVMIAVAAGVVALIVGIIVFVFVKLGGSDLGYVKRHAPIAWPARLGDIETFGDGETFVVAFGRVEDVSGFLARNDFSTAPDVDAMRDYVAPLRPEHRRLPAAAEARGSGGTSEGTRWIAVLDASDGRLWVVVLAPAT